MTERLGFLNKTIRESPTRLRHSSDYPADDCQEHCFPGTCVTLTATHPEAACVSAFDVPASLGLSEHSNRVHIKGRKTKSDNSLVEPDGRTASLLPPSYLHHCTLATGELPQLTHIDARLDGGLRS